MAHLSWYTGDANANTFWQDFSPLVMAPPVPGADIALWPILGKRADSTEVEKKEWVEEELTPISVTGTEGSGDGWNSTNDTAWDFDEADVKKAGIRAGAMLMDATDRTKKEVSLVTGVSGGKLTVVRDYGGHVSGSGGGTTGEAHATTCTFEIIGYLNFQGSSVTKTDNFAKRNRTTKHNYFSILDDWLQITVEDLVREYRGSSPDNWGYQLAGIKQRLERIFERHIWHSPMVQMTSTERGSMGGLRWFATQPTQTAAGAYVTTSETFDFDVFDAGAEFFYNQGTFDGPADIVCIMPPKGIKAAARIHESAFRGEYANELVRGMRCTQLMSSITGDKIPLVPSRNIPSDSMLLLNLNAVQIHFLKGLGLAVFNKDVGEGLDAFRAGRLYSVISMECQRPTENMYFHTGIDWGV